MHSEKFFSSFLRITHECDDSLYVCLYVWHMTAQSALVPLLILFYYAINTCIHPVYLVGINNFCVSLHACMHARLCTYSAWYLCIFTCIWIPDMYLRTVVISRTRQYRSFSLARTRKKNLPSLPVNAAFLARQRRLPCPPTPPSPARRDTQAQRLLRQGLGGPGCRRSHEG